MPTHNLAAMLALLSAVDFAFIILCLTDSQISLLNEFDKEFPLLFWKRIEELSSTNDVSVGIRDFIRQRLLEQCPQVNVDVAA